jgi:drug/metabolite transporter (DMT)-like permease
MMGIVLALLASFAYSLSAILIRMKLDESDYLSATVIVIVTGNLVLWPPALIFTNLKTMNLQSFLLFIIAGILAPGITRILYNKGIETLGVALNASIFATYPIYSTILAVLLLDEILIPQNWIGLIFIVVGVIIIERDLDKYEVRVKVSRRSLFFPLFATLTIASSQILRKYGLSISNEPLLGVAVGYSSALLLYLPILVFSNNFQCFFRKGFKLFWKAGVCLALGWLLSFYALSFERVSIVIPLIQMEPLFVLLLTYLYLKKLECITLRTVISTFLIFIGAMLVSM